MIATNLTTAPTSWYHVGFVTKLLTHHWMGSMFFALGTHVALWYLPVYLPSQKHEPPQPIRLMLQPPQPAPVQPRPEPPKIRPEPRRKPPKRRIKKRRIIRKQQIQKQQMVREIPPIPRQRTQPLAPQHPTPLLPPRAVARVSPQAMLPLPQPVAPPTLPPVVAKSVDLRPYGRSLYQSILRHKRYPQMAARMGYEGTVVLVIRVSCRGHLVGQPRIARSSGFAILDQEAIRMVQSAAPWPAMPHGFSQPYKAFRMPVRFSLDS